ncbi:MAG: type II toxin-antitoxin system RelE/ParE family toxin [Verrucomicrobia bacterium]|nr:type II toxin-antitoxin system RelE/ParE family toxin [Verrucomicrobiota bacterium]
MPVVVRPVLFSEAARAELIEAQDWYEAQAPGLGQRFRAEIDTVVQRMADKPRQFPIVFKTLRRARAKKFPYAIFFLIESDSVLVIACFHASRDPRHWQKRV